MDAKKQTSDLSTIVQEIVDRVGWAATNAMAFIIEGSGRRVAESYDGEASAAAKLVVEHCEPVVPTIGDIVFEDIDGDGMQDTNEPGINGVSIDLIDSSNSVVDTRVTAGSGNYAFASPASGGYTIDVTSTLTGYTLTTGNEPFALNGYVNGTAVDNVDFGYRQTGSGSIGGLIWNDLDGDGSAAGEPGIGNVTVDLYRDLNNSDTLDAGDAYVGTRTTTGSGNYDFTGLPDAEYVVDVTDTNSVLVGKSVTGGTDPAAVSLSGAAAINDIDFGYAELSCTTVDLQQGLNAYSGAADTYIWQAQATTNFEDTTPTPLLADGDDPSGSGNDVSSLLSWDISSIPAGSEIQSASIRINVENATAAPGFDLYAMEQAWTEGGATWETYDGSTVWPGGSGGAGTGSRGSTALGNVAPTSTDFYDLTLNSAGVSVLQDWLDNPANNRGLMVWAGSTTDGLDFSAKENGITASRPRLRVEYCQLVIPRDLGDRVWDDRDFDGIQDVGEPGLIAVTINLLDAGLNQVDTTTSDSDGRYGFSGLTNGATYTLEVEVPEGYRLTPNDQGANDAADSDAIPASGRTLPFVWSGLDETRDFGFQRTGSGSIGGLVWNDLDGDGSAAGEPGIGNVTVDLYRDLNNSDTLDAGDAYVGTRTTTGSGNYDFTGLPDAEYVVDVTDTNSVLVGKSVTGGTDLAAVSLSGGAAINDIDFGYAELSCTTVDLQQGLNGYSGAADTYIWQAQATTNFEDTTPTPLLADGDDPSGSGNDVSSLLSWDISSIPAGSEIQSASIRINVENATAAPGFDLYAMEQAWTEGGATWETYDGSTVWPGGSGGAGTGSRGSTALGNVAPTSTDFYDLTLNSAGVSVLQDWLDNPANNRGLMVWAGSTTDGLDFSAKENGITASRPRLRVEYCQLVIPRDLGDRVWDDRDFDGIQDVGEPGLIAVTINLLDAGLNQVDTTTSDSDGRYGFSGLTNGATYTLEVEVPEGYRLTPKDLGANDAADSDAIPASGRTLPFVWSGLDETRDFGLYLAPGPAYPSLCYAASDNGGGSSERRPVELRVRPCDPGGEQSPGGGDGRTPITRRQPRIHRVRFRFRPDPGRWLGRFFGSPDHRDRSEQWFRRDHLGTL